MKKNRADLLVMGLPRTGTTMLCGLLTDQKKRRICFCEPGPFGGPKHPRAFKQARSFALAPKSEKTEDVLRTLYSLERFGVKEVQPHLYRAAYEQLNPRRILVCLRDAVDVAISLREFRVTKDKSAESVSDRVKKLSEDLLRFLDDLQDSKVNLILVKYEDLTTSKRELDHLTVSLDWPLTGNPNLLLTSYRRSDEERNGVFSRRDHKDRERNSDLLDLVVKKCQTYQSRFGYT